MSDYARQENHERVDDALHEGQGHHVSVCDVRNLMRQDGFDFISRHASQQACTDCNQGGIAPGASGKCVHVLRIVNGNLRCIDSSLSCLPFDDVQQPRLDVIARLRYHLRAGRAFGHPLRHGERNERTAETDNQG
jgi:hypothetical protein